MVNSGSSAITLAMKCLNVNKGDEIITPCLNFGTAVSSIIEAGAIPIFIDVEVDTLQIDIKKIEKNNQKNQRISDSKFNWKYSRFKRIIQNKKNTIYFYLKILQIHWVQKLIIFLLVNLAIYQ